MVTALRRTLNGWLLAVLVSGCSTTYEPHLVLPPAELNRTIDAVVEVHPFVASDDLLFGHSHYGVLADDYSNHSPSQLTQSLTQQVTAELAAHRVFRKVSTYDPSPDLILTGRVDRFFEHDRRKLWTFIPYYSNKLASLFRVNSYTTTGEIHLTLTLLKPTGKVIGSYVGHATFNEDYTPNSDVHPGDRLNRALGQAVAQIRDEMFADTSLAKTRLTDPVARQ
jgi:hypothetical protein